MQISFMLARDGRRANWDVNVYGPCSDGSQLGRTIGTQVQPPEPLLRIRDGRFALHHSASVETTGISRARRRLCIGRAG